MVLNRKEAFMVFAILMALQGEPKFEDKTIDLNGAAIKYQVCVPSGYDGSKPMPLILFLHGSGEQGDDGVKQSTVGIGPAIKLNPQGWAPYITVIPQKPICGGGNPADGPKLKDIPLWAFHGDKDTAVPLRKSEEMIEAVKAAGGSPKLTVYPGVGHNSWDKAYRDEKLWEWFLQHSKK